MSQAIEPTGASTTSSSSSSVTKGYANRTFWLLWFANFINYADRYAFLALGTYVITEFHLTDFQYGLLATSFLFVYTFSILPLGLLADRIRRKNVVAGGIAFWSVITGITAISPNYGSLFATRAALGLGEGSYFPASTSMLASVYSKDKRAIVMSQWNTGLLAGLAFGYVGAGILYGVFSNQWRPVFYIFAIPGLVLSLLIYLMKEPPRHAEDNGANVEATIARGGLAGIWQNITELWQIATLRIVVALQALSFFVYGATLVFITPLFARLYPDSPISGLTLIGVGTVIGGVIGLLAGGAIADRLIKRIPGARVLVERMELRDLGAVLCTYYHLIAHPSFRSHFRTHFGDFPASLHRDRRAASGQQRPVDGSLARCCHAAQACRRRGTDAAALAFPGGSVLASDCWIPE